MNAPILGPAQRLGAPGWVDAALESPHGLARLGALVMLASLARLQSVYGRF